MMNSDIECAPYSSTTATTFSDVNPTMEKQSSATSTTSMQPVKRQFSSSSGSSVATPITSTSSSVSPGLSFCQLLVKQFFSPYATPFFQLKDKSLRTRYRDFNVEQEASLYPIVITIAMFCVLPLFIGMTIQSQGNLADLVISSLLCFAILAVGILGIFVAYFHYWIDWAKACLTAINASHPETFGLQRTNSLKSRHYYQDIIKNCQSWLHTIGYLHMFFFEAMVILFALRRGHSHICIDAHIENHVSPGFQNAINIFFCGSDIKIIEDSHLLSIDAIYLLAIAPLINAVIFPSLNVLLLWLQIAVSLAVFIFISVDNHGHLRPHVPAVTTIFAWASTNFFIIAHMQLDKINRFYMHLQLVDLIEENQRNAEAFHVNEMRFLIANVAHDLKTPLMSFTSAITLISQYADEFATNPYVVNSCSKMHKDGTDQSCVVSAFLFNLKTCLVSLSDTNAFMVMTINRCIDYAKAAKGIKLSPKLETVHVWETLQLPLSCMRNVQDKVEIQLIKPIESDVCPYIITDKQWLQENILCLLSNAVKYSNRGKVTVSVSLMETAVVVPNSDGCTTENSDTGDSSGKSTLSAPSRYLMFEIEDNGIGISPQAMSQLFQPFKQTQRLAGGTGLGLYSLAKRIEGIQGECGVRGRKDGGKGSLFWFMIPYRPDEAFAANAQIDDDSSDTSFAGSTNGRIESTSLELGKPHHMLSPPTPPAKYAEDPKPSPTSITIKSFLRTPLTAPRIVRRNKALPPLPPLASPLALANSLDILLVDDAQTIVKMTSMMLKKLGGHRIVTAENGEVAVNTVETFWKEEGKCFDVILMDLQMPVLDGLEATKRIRAMENMDIEGKLPRRQLIVGVSANSDHETEEQALACGVDVFIAKPFTAAAFTKVISNHHICQSLK